MKENIKILSFMFALSIIVNLNISAQATYSSTTIHTPKGSSLTGWILTGGDYNSSQKTEIKNQLLEYYDNRIVFMSEATWSYNCHGEAWWSTEGGQDLWIGRYSADDEDVFWEDGSYIEVPIQSWATKVSYGVVNHSAITTGITNWFISKWGAGPLFAHDRADCPYDDGDLHYYAKNNAGISGPSTVCPSTTEFLVVNLLPGATVSWSTSSNITRVSGQGTNPCLFEANGSGEYGWIDATFTFNGTQYNLGQRDVWVGSDLPDPVNIGIKGENYEFIEHTNDTWELCPNTIYRLQANTMSTVTGWNWTIPWSWELLSDGNSPEILIQTGDNIYWEDEVDVAVYNATCDTWLYGADYLLVTLPPYGCGESLQLKLYPNPAKNNITLQININDGGLNKISNANINISIIDKSGRVWLNKVTKENILNMDISDLPIGEYTVVTSIAQKSKSLKFIKSN